MLNDGRWLKMVTIGYKWLQMVTDGYRWRLLVTIGDQWRQLATNGDKPHQKCGCAVMGHGCDRNPFDGGEGFHVGQVDWANRTLFGYDLNL